MRLYHGTSDARLAAIQAQGLERPYATISEDLAAYYAQEACEEYGGRPVLLEFEVAEQALLPDGEALAEPVVYGIDDIPWRTGDEVLEAIEAHDGPLDVAASLHFTASVIVDAQVPGRDIEVLDW